MSFVHLHTHSHFTLLGGLPKIKQLIKYAKENNTGACAVTDLGNMYGAIQLIQNCQENGIKPIVGLTLNVITGSLEEYKKSPSNHMKLVLLASSSIGYKNLITLSTEAMTHGRVHMEHVVELSFLQKYANDIICLNDGLHYRNQYSPTYIKEKEIIKNIEQLKNIFGDRYYAEIFPDDEDAHRYPHNTLLQDLSKKMNFKLVATNNAYYIKKSDKQAQDILLCIGRKCTIKADQRDRLTGERHFLSEEDLKKKLSEFPEAFDSVEEIVQRCNLEYKLDDWKFANFPIPSDTNYDDFLHDYVYRSGQKKLGREFTEEEKQRMEYELNIIKGKGYSPYFLIVADFLNWARERKIIVTTRGSAAGSFVSFAIGITNLNPLNYSLPFERFLNPLRPSAPDVDADIADYRREEVIDYVRKKYGENRVAQICTFGTMQARAAVRDAGRALGMSYGACDRIAKLIPFGKQGMPMSIARALEETPDFRRVYEEDEEIASLIDISKTIEGCARHVSIHAAGVVISPTSLTDFMPVQYENTEDGSSIENPAVITQYEMKSAELAGLLKMDFLGIRNLSILEQAVLSVEKRFGVHIDVDNIPLDDAKVYETLARGRTVGVFQMSGSGMTKYLMDLKPERIEDIMAMVALYRPGPIDSIPEYIDRKFGRKPVVPIHPDLSDILEKSYGLLVYQDDVMLTAIKLAGYDWLEADKFRKAMGKKIPEEMAKQKSKFYEGCEKYGIKIEEIDEIWSKIEPFAAYGFNKAHAASYGIVAYQTAYMKTHYPAEFMAAVLSNESHILENVAEATGECKKLQIPILPPSVNASYPDFVVETFNNKDAIRYGLKAIKGVGAHIVEVIAKERDENGVYKDLEDFLLRVQDKDLNRRSLDGLIRSGSLDCFAPREILLHNIEKIISFSQQRGKELHTRQENLFANQPLLDQFRIKLDYCPEIDPKEKIQWEKELLGIFLSEHPFASIEKNINGLTLEYNILRDYKDKLIRIAGVATSIKYILTKKGEKMCFITFENTTESLELIVFPKILRETEDIWKLDNSYVVDGRVSVDEDTSLKILVEKVIEIDTHNARNIILNLPPIEQKPLYRKKAGEKVSAIHNYISSETPENEKEKDWIQIRLPQTTNRETLKTLKELIARFPGNSPVYVILPHQSETVKTNQKANYSQELVKRIDHLLGEKCIQYFPQPFKNIN